MIVGCVRNQYNIRFYYELGSYVLTKPWHTNRVLNIVGIVCGQSMENTLHNLQTWFLTTSKHPNGIQAWNTIEEG